MVIQKRKKSFALALLLFFGFSTPSFAAIEFFGYAKVKPTYYSNFDFDNDRPDTATLNEGGWTSGEHLRSELRLGWKASGEKWSIMMQAEADVIMNKNNADRSFYAGATQGDPGQPNAGGEFGIERAEFNYSFLPQLKLSTGWNIRALDIKTGGLLFGDDHPFLGLSGAITGNLNYELLYIPIQNFSPIGQSLPTVEDDWRVYSVKFDYQLGKDRDGKPRSSFYSENALTISPLFAFSDNRGADGGNSAANVYYYGLEGLGKLGPVKPSFEIVFADGKFDDERDISSMAAFAAIEFPINKAFNPYIAGRYTQGDDDRNDNDVEGFVGITDIGRFTPLMGMDGNILGEHLSSGASIYNSPLYSFSPDRAVGGNAYGGISNASSGNNPGQKLLAIGTKGELSPKFLYKAQAFMIWYDETDNLVNVKNPGQNVDDYAGTTFDLQLLYTFSKNFSIDNIFSTFIPGDGIEDQVNADDPAIVNMLTLAWTY